MKTQKKTVSPVKKPVREDRFRIKDKTIDKRERYKAIELDIEHRLSLLANLKVS